MFGAAVSNIFSEQTDLTDVGYGVSSRGTGTTRHRVLHGGDGGAKVLAPAVASQIEACLDVAGIRHQTDPDLSRVDSQVEGEVGEERFH